MERIKGRTAFITGAASGIGLAIAQALAEQGARIVLADIDGDRLARLVERLGDNAMAVRLDVVDRQAWADAKQAVEVRFGPVDILVNNAGIGPDGRALADMDPASFDRLVAIKLTGTFNGIHCFAAGMRDRGDGHIVNTASMAGLITSARLGAYTASKFAVVGLSEVLRAEMADHGVGVSVLCPGLIATRLGETTEKAGSERIALRNSQAAEGLDAALVGPMVVAGIRANRAHIVTHGDYRSHVAARMARVLSAFDDVPLRNIDALPGTDVARD